VLVLALGRHLHRHAVHGELGEHRLLAAERPRVQLEPVAAVGALHHAGEGGQVDRPADDLDAGAGGRDAERVRADQHRRVRRQRVEQSRCVQARVPVVGHGLQGSEAAAPGRPLRT
jgi:hypothetical protein